MRAKRNERGNVGWKTNLRRDGSLRLRCDGMGERRHFDSVVVCLFSQSQRRFVLLYGEARTRWLPILPQGAGGKCSRPCIHIAQTTTQHRSVCREVARLTALSTIKNTLIWCCGRHISWLGIWGHMTVAWWRSVWVWLKTRCQIQISWSILYDLSWRPTKGNSWKRNLTLKLETNSYFSVFPEFRWLSIRRFWDGIKRVKKKNWMHKRFTFCALKLLND